MVPPKGPTAGSRRRAAEPSAPKHGRGTPVAITGMHRSGTSMVARLLQACGVSLGSEEDLLPPAADNPEGFWEHQGVVSANDELLQAFGGAWDLPPGFTPGWADDARAQVVAAGAADLLERLAADGVWGFKDPRLCLTLPFWSKLSPSLRTVVCVRNPLEVAASLRERNGTSYALGLALWERYVRDVLAATSGAPRVLTHFDAYFFDAEGELGRVGDWVGLTLDPVAIDAAVAGRRGANRHSRFGRQDLKDAGLAARIVDLYDALCEEACWHDDRDHRAAGRQRPPAAAPSHAERDEAVSAGPAGPHPPAPVTLDVAVVDYRLLHWRYLRRGGHIAALERRVDDLERQLAAAEQERDAAFREAGEHRARRRSSEIDLLSSVHSLLDRVDGIEVALRAPGTQRDDPLPAWVARSLVTATPPVAAVVAAISEPVPRTWMGRRMVALPRAEARAAAWQIEALRANGSEFLFLSADARVSEAPLIEALRHRFPLVETPGGSLTVDLRRDLDLARGLGRLVAEHEAERGVPPTVLAWGCKLDASGALQLASAPDGERLDYLDRSFDLVLVPSGREDLLAEAGRVAAFAAAEVDGDADPVVVRRCGAPGRGSRRPPLTLVVTGLASAAAPIAFLRTCLEGAAGADVELFVDEAVGVDLADRIAADVGLAGTVTFTEVTEGGLGSLETRGEDGVVVGVEATAVPVGAWARHVLRTFAQHEAGVVCPRAVSFDGRLVSAGSAAGGGPEAAAAGARLDPSEERFRRVRTVGAPAGPALAVDRRRWSPDRPAKVVYQPDWVTVSLDGAPTFAPPGW